MKIKKLLLPTLLSIATMPIQAADLPNITILATGGTIAGSQKKYGNLSLSSWAAKY